MSPKGVEHLSMPAQNVQPGTVNPSMLPKGVEHRQLRVVFVAGLRNVVNPSMSPKGVEHAMCTAFAMLPAAVNPSMSPKGVEHRPGTRTRKNPLCESINVAERR